MAQSVKAKGGEAKKAPKNTKKVSVAKAGKITELMDYAKPLIQSGKYKRTQVIEMSIKKLAGKVSEATVRAQVYRATRPEKKWNRWGAIAVEEKGTKLMSFGKQVPK